MALENPTAAISTAFPGKTFTNGDSVTVGNDSYTYNDGEFSLGGESSDGVSKSTTPTTWDGPKDARELEGAGKYPNFYALNKSVTRCLMSYSCNINCLSTIKKFD